MNVHKCLKGFSKFRRATVETCFHYCSLTVLMTLAVTVSVIDDVAH